MAKAFGWTDEEISRLEFGKIKQYLLALDALDHREMLREMKIAEYPEMKLAQKRSMHNDIYKAAYPSTTRKSVTIKEFIKQHGYECN